MTTSSTGTAGDKPALSGFAVSERTAYLRAQTALFMRDHVLSLVSHDLRGPLNAIHSWAYVLERKLDANDPNSQRAVNGIRNGVDQQVKLLETIVDATRAETKSLVLSHASIECCVESLAPLHRHWSPATTLLKHSVSSVGLRERRYRHSSARP